MSKETVLGRLGPLALILTCSCPAIADTVPAEQVVRETGAAAGLVVHLGTTDGQLEIEFARRGSRCVHGLALSEPAGERARQAIRTAGQYGVSSAEAVSSLKRLPYVDNLVNLLVADLDALADQAPAKPEIERVLVPNGVAYLKQKGNWTKSVKPRPAGMDDWTHPLHGPDESKTSADRLVGAPTGVQWVAGPLFTMAERKSSTESIVSAGGRIFYMTQNETANFTNEQKVPPNFLVARDAFNGLLLWERPSRGRHIGRAAVINPRLVATERHLHVVEEGELVALDAATGRPQRTYATESFPDKFLVSGNRVIVESKDGITAFAADSAERLWHYATTYPLSGTVASGQWVCCFETSRAEGGFLVVLDAQTGKQQWRQRLHEAGVRPFGRNVIDLAFLQPERLGIFNQERLQVFAASDGKELWSRKLTDNKYGLAYLVGDLVWVQDRDQMLGLDPRTGEQKQQAPMPARLDVCQLPFVSANLVIDPRHPTVVDLLTGQKTAFDFTRGGCGVGFVPANGLLYTVPNACACFRDALRGFLALSSVPRSPVEETWPRLEKGQAYADGSGGPVPERLGEEWPTYRHDALRSARTPVAVPGKPREVWKTRLAGAPTVEAHDEWQLRIGAPFTAPVVSGNKVFLTIPNAHQLVALDADNGKLLWQFTAGGRIDTPPTIAAGLCLFGSHDGWVYCVRATDGQLVWRYLAAPSEQRLIAYGQLESVWPVLGSVLIHDGVAYVAAGRAPGSDGGLHVHALEPRSGRVLWSRNLAKADKGGLCDLLVSSGEALCVAGYELDWKTGAVRPKNRAATYLRGGMAGLLEASWTRLPIALRKSIQTWTYGEASGQLLAFGPESVYGYYATEGRTPRKQPDDLLFATGDRSWKVKIASPLQIEALILTRDLLWVAGTGNREQRQTGGGLVRGLDRADGKTIAEVRLTASPVYDGLAAAYGRLFVVTEDGHCLCLGQ